MKLTKEYKKLVKKYPCEDKWVVGDDDNLPIIVLAQEKNGLNLAVNDSKVKYTLPELIKENRLKILREYADSNIYNQLCIRVNDVKKTDDGIILSTSRTSYFDSLCTNRAIDYKLDDVLSIRDLYCYGPFVDELSESKLSNHLGFNGFIISSDNKIGLIKRNCKVSVGKNEYGTMVSASLKSKYALDDNQKLSKEGIFDSFYEEIVDEVGIEPKHIKIIAFYRDMVEGGKPQFLISAETNKSSGEINAIFNDKVATAYNGKTVEEKMSVDGDTIFWVDLKESIYYGVDHIKVNNISLNMNPSTIASLKMFLECENSL